LSDKELPAFSVAVLKSFNYILILPMAYQQNESEEIKMKHMKKIVLASLALAIVLIASTAFAAPAYARGRSGGSCCRGSSGASQQQSNISRNQAVQRAQYFNADGVQVTFRPANLWQDADGNAMFGRGCWFVDENGKIVSIWNEQVFDADGNPVIWGGNGWGDCCAAFWL
jgi:hypothetical protein